MLNFSVCGQFTAHCWPKDDWFWERQASSPPLHSWVSPKELKKHGFIQVWWPTPHLHLSRIFHTTSSTVPNLWIYPPPPTPFPFFTLHLIFLLEMAQCCGSADRVRALGWASGCATDAAACVCVWNLKHCVMQSSLNIIKNLMGIMSNCSQGDSHCSESN